MSNDYHDYITAVQGEYDSRGNPYDAPGKSESFWGSSAAFAPAMAYIPFQSWGNVYAPEVGFQRGTLFQVLDKPFLGEEAIPRG